MRRAWVLLPVAAVVLLGALLVGRLGAGTAAQDATPAATVGHPVVGTWLLDADADDPANPPEVVVFTADGAYASADAEGSPGLGVWAATGERTATLTIVSPIGGEEEGFFGTFTIRATVEVDPGGAAFTAQYTGEFVGPDGASPGEYGPGTATATRIAAEAPGAPVGPLDELFGQFEGTPAAGTPAAGAGAALERRLETDPAFRAAAAADPQGALADADLAGVAAIDFVVPGGDGPTEPTTTEMEDGTWVCSKKGDSISCTCTTCKNV